MMKPRPSKRPARAILADLRARHTIPQVAAILGVSEGAIKLWCRDFGLTRAPRPPERPKRREIHAANSKLSKHPPPHEATPGRRTYRRSGIDRELLCRIDRMLPAPAYACVICDATGCESCNDGLLSLVAAVELTVSVNGHTAKQHHTTITALRALQSELRR